MTTVDAGPTEALLEAEHLRVTFPIRQRPFQRRLPLHAVQDVSITIGPRETFGLDGESGSGKSTIGRALQRLVKIDEGRIRLNGRDITALSPRELRPLRRELQMVFQDPYSSLDPSAVVATIVREPYASMTA